MRIEANANILLGTPRVGQGKDTFLNAVREHLEYSPDNTAGMRVDIIEPQHGNIATKAMWQLIRQFYLVAGKAKPIQDIYGAVHRNTSVGIGDRLITSLANRELVRALEASGKPFLTFHGLLGKGAKRFFAEGDVFPEPRAADKRTIAFVPLEETRIALEQFGQTEQSIAVGFIVPQILKDPTHVQERIERFKNGGPINVAFMITGQFANQHLDILHRNVLPEMHPWIRSRRAKLTVYMWNSQKHALEVAESAKQLGLKARINIDYIPNAPWGIQICWNQDPDKAAKMSFAIASDSDKLITPAAERMPWFAYVSAIPLPVIRGNIKMEHDAMWAQQQGLIAPVGEIQHLGETLKSDFANGGQRIVDHYERAQHIFLDGKLLNGAETIAQIMRNEVKLKSYGQN